MTEKYVTYYVWDCLWIAYYTSVTSLFIIDFFSMLKSTDQKCDMLFVKFALWKHLGIIHQFTYVYMHNAVFYKHLRPNPNSIISLKKSPLISTGITVSLKTGCRKKSTKYSQLTLISEHCSSLRTKRWSDLSFLQVTCRLFTSKSIFTFLIVKYSSYSVVIIKN